MAEKVVVQASKCVAVPDFLPLEEAAALQLTYGTAHNALCGSGQLEAGQTLLVLGAAGGVGMASVEVGKALGATVIAAVSSPEKAEAVRSRGADHVIIYAPGELCRDERRSLAVRFRDTDAGRPHVVLDPVGGSYSEAALRAIRRGGRMVVVGFAAGIPEVPLNLVLFNEAIICAGAWGAVVANQPERYRCTISGVLELYRKKLIRPFITARLPLERGAEALSMLEGRSSIGKVVVLVGSEQV
jgi:NADPH2:quinone reductase